MNPRHDQVPRLLVTALCVALLTSCSTTPDPPAPATATTSSFSPPPTVGESGPAEGWVGNDELTDTAGAPVDPHPHDSPSDEQVVAAVTTAAQVITGWLTADQDQRRQLLEGVCAEALIASFDDPRFTPAAQRQQGPTHVVYADEMQILTRHRLNTGDVVNVTLVLDPAATHGWLAVAITN